ncbi:unnamed protein product [Prunus brigantina]
MTNECNKHVSIECARQVGANIFEGGASVTNACFHELVSVGKICHDLFFNSSISSKPNVNKSKALAKNAQVWSLYVLQLQFLSHLLSQFQP